MEALLQIVYHKKRGKKLYSCISKIRGDDHTINNIMLDLINKDIKKRLTKLIKENTLMKNVFFNYLSMLSSEQGIRSQVNIKVPPRKASKYVSDDIYKIIVNLFRSERLLLNELDKLYLQEVNINVSIFNNFSENIGNYFDSIDTNINYADLKSILLYILFLTNRTIFYYEMLELLNLFEELYFAYITSKKSKGPTIWGSKIQFARYFSMEKYQDKVYLKETIRYFKDFIRSLSTASSGPYYDTQGRRRSGVSISNIPFDMFIVSENYIVENNPILSEHCVNRIPNRINVYAKMHPGYSESTEVMIALNNLNTLPEFKTHVLKFSKIDNWDNADFIFRGRTLGFDDKLFRRLSNAKFGLISHFSSVESLKKANLPNFLQKNKITHIAPITFVWKRDKHNDVVKGLQKYGNDESLWIVKPTEIGKNILSFGGYGIQLLTLDKIKNTTDWMGEMKSAVIQEYIVNPLLYKGRKFDLRIYVLVLPVIGSKNPSKLQAFLYWGGFSRTSLIQYDPQSTDVSVVVTNYAVQKPLLEQQKKTVDDIVQDMFELDCFDPESVLEDIKVLVTTLFKKVDLNPRGYSASFQIFGLDVILDSNKKPLVLEVNLTPALLYLNKGTGHKTNVPNALNRAIEYAFKNRVGCEIITPDRTRYEYTRIF